MGLCTYYHLLQKEISLFKAEDIANPRGKNIKIRKWFDKISIRQTPLCPYLGAYDSLATAFWPKFMVPGVISLWDSPQVQLNSGWLSHSYR